MWLYQQIHNTCRAVKLLSPEGCGWGVGDRGRWFPPAGLPWPCPSPKVARLDWMFPLARFSSCAPVWKISSSCFWRPCAQDPRLLFMSQCLCCPAGQTQPSKQAFRFDCRPGLKAKINDQFRRESWVSISAGVKARRACRFFVSPFLTSALRQTLYMFMIWRCADNSKERDSRLADSSSHQGHWAAPSQMSHRGRAVLSRRKMV